MRIPAGGWAGQGPRHHHLDGIVAEGRAPEPADTQGRFFEYGLYCASDPPGGTWEDGEVLDFDAGRRVLLDGDGTRAAATAARFPSLGARSCAVEMENGSIQHALFRSAAHMDDFGCGDPASQTAAPFENSRDGRASHQVPAQGRAGRGHGLGEIEPSDLGLPYRHDVRL